MLLVINLSHCSDLYTDLLKNRIIELENQLLEKNAIKQIFHAFLFNIRNYSPEVINIQ